MAIAQHILDHPAPWRPLLTDAQPADGDRRSVWHRMQADVLTPEALLALLNQTTLEADYAEMLRIESIEIQSLDAFQARTRWVGSEDETPTAVADVNATTKFAMGQGLAAHLQQQLAEQMQGIQHQKLAFTNAEVNFLSHLRLLLAADARLLLQGPDFAAFVRSMCDRIATQEIEFPGSFDVAPSPADWQLHRLSTPLELHILETIESDPGESAANSVHLRVKLGTWQQTLTIPTLPTSSSVDSDDQITGRVQQWRQIRNQLQTTMAQLPIAPYSQVELEELACLLTYIGDLFHIDPVVNPFYQMTMRMGSSELLVKRYNGRNSMRDC
jgi:hypothetical protein